MRFILIEAFRPEVMNCAVVQKDQSQIAAGLSVGHTESRDQNPDTELLPVSWFASP